MGKPRIVRMVVVMDVAVASHAWNARHIEGAIETLMQALVTSSQHPDFRNIDVRRYAVHTLAGAYDELLKPWGESHAGDSGAPHP
jgi:hypothetical protein